MVDRPGDALGPESTPPRDGHPKSRTGCIVPGLPDGFQFHVLRHYLASLLIASGADVKVVQARIRHPSVKTTLDTHGHLWRTRTSPPAPPFVLAARVDSSGVLADSMRTAEAQS
ncbi:tyrosine-type recombinase/integrase [Kribbella sp. NPDC049227]|uniref:tyrosine-type recombinase/integrase n=1 Tax=Kribbella sp. NPDC049227 TaxID=3364113 RepID=UPI00371E2E37